MRETLFEHQVIVLPAQDLRPGDFVAFARRFGRPVPHVLSHLRLPDFPEILPLSNTFEDGKATGVDDGAAYWHTNMSYEDPPGSVTLAFHPRPPGGGTRALPTCFAPTRRWTTPCVAGSTA